MPGYAHKDSYFEYRLCHIFSGEHRNKLYGRQLFFCDRICTQSKRIYEDILVAFDREKCGLENGV